MFVVARELTFLSLPQHGQWKLTPAEGILLEKTVGLLQSVDDPTTLDPNSLSDDVFGKCMHAVFLYFYLCLLYSFMVSVFWGSV